MGGYIGNIPVPQGTQTRQNFTATASQTSFSTIGYTAGFIDVYLNGVKLINGTDFTATNGSDVVLASAASASDVLDVVIFDTFDTSSGTFSDTTLKNNVTLKNDTEEDSDGGRASKIIYQGEQSGGEISTLAEIQASHDGTADDQKGDLIFRTNDGSDNAAPTEVARMDSSANFLVSTTGVNPHNASSASDAGAAIRSDGRILAGVNQDNPAVFNRIGNDGNIAAFKKDGSPVGSIGIQSTGFYVDGETGHAGLRFAGNEISPRDNGADADGTVSLGESDKRFENLYLSGGVIFDAVAGNATSNTLGDYEEGTWTPSSPDVTLSGIESSTYTKIGRMVFVQAKFTLPTSSSSTQAKVDGLPFTVDGNGTNSQYNLSAGEHTFGSYITCPAIPSNRIVFRPNGGSSATYATVSGKTFRLSGWYET